MTIMQDFITNTLNLNNIQIDYATRMGRKTMPDKSRRILVRFVLQSQRNLVFDKRTLLTDNGNKEFYISPHLPPRVSQRQYEQRLQKRNENRMDMGLSNNQI